MLVTKQLMAAIDFHCIFYALIAFIVYTSLIYTCGLLCIVHNFKIIYAIFIVKYQYIFFL